MNKIFLSLSLSLIISLGYSQLPNINLKDVNGVTENLSKFSISQNRRMSTLDRVMSKFN